MKKTPKPSTKRSKSTKICTRDHQDFAMIYAFKQKPVSDAFLSDLAWDLITWAKDENIRDLRKFLVSRNICKQSFYNWCKRFPMLDEAREFAKMCIASNLFDGAVTKKYDASLATKVLPMYDDEWKQLNEWYAKLRETHDNKSGNITVVMSSFKEEEQLTTKE